jgi:hypothetical protein
MRRTGSVVLAALAGLWFLVQSPLAFAAGPDCLRGFVVEIRKAVGNQEEAEEMFARIAAFSDDGARGATMAVQQVRGDRFSTLWEHLDELESLGRNPFTKDDEVFEVIAKLVDFNTEGATGVFGHLASSEINDAQGALFQLYVTKKTAGNGTNYAAIEALERNLPGIGGVTRRVDLVETGGILHEIKSWLQAITNPNDARLADYALEFQSDIVLCEKQGFANYRVHFPELINTDAQKTLIKTKLLQQFDEPSVIAHFAGDEGALAAAKQQFSNAWDAGTIAEFHPF